MKSDLEKVIEQAVYDIFRERAAVDLAYPDEKFGDYSTNVAMTLAGKLKKSPTEISAKLGEAIKQNKEFIKSVDMAGPGFMNITLTDKALWSAMSNEPRKQLDGQSIIAEYSDPSAFKVLHVGHLYTSLVGDAIANLLEAVGGEVHRVNFGGDVGLHVAKTMWAIIRALGGEKPLFLERIDVDKRAEWMSERYVEGNAEYDDDEHTKQEILELNKRIYRIHTDNDHNSPFAKIYWTCRQWSYDYFDMFYALIGSHFEKYYPESLTMPVGIKTVKEQLVKGVYKESDGAIIFPGEKYGLHTRVFINSQGLPTYETKDVGLIMMKWQDYHYDKSIILTDSSQAEYMAVVLKSVEQFAKELVDRTTHITHGRVKLAGDVKMSSRKGNIVRAVDVLSAVDKANKKLNGHNANDAAVLGAVKYAFLKNRIGADIVYDPEESVSLEGNSGPYLQYSHARACSIVQKSKSFDEEADSNNFTISLETDERSLARKISEYPDVVNRAAEQLMPHLICTYLYELSQNFNSFYEHNRVIGGDRELQRIQLVSCYAKTLRSGLALLGIEAPEHI